MNKIDELFPDLVSNELYDKLSLNSNEMKRRRFLLKKSNLNEKQTRELEILNVRCFLNTKDSYKPKPKKISRIKKPSVKNIKANFEWNTALHGLSSRDGEVYAITKEIDYELEYCEQCNQMTNHLNGVCQKCK